MRTSNKTIEKYVESCECFLNKLKSSFPKQVVVGFSGGVDSWALFLIFFEFLKQKKIDTLRVILVDHGTRFDQNDWEKKFSRFFSKINIPFIVRRSLVVKGPNFEQRARKVRREILFKELDRGEVLLLGHHLDDSFEWSLMQSLKSSRLKKSLGIPVVNGEILRPLLTFSKKQLHDLVAISSVPIWQDPSNDEIRFERNLMRQHVKNLKKQYPQFLYHYVNRSNHLAEILNLSAFKEKIACRVFSRKRGTLMRLQAPGNFDGHEDLICEEVEKLSKSFRGELRREVQKLIDAEKNHKFGPMNLSGGVQVFIGECEIYMTCLKYLSPEKIISEGTQIPVFQLFDEFKKGNLKFPAEVVVKKNALFKGRQKKYLKNKFHSIIIKDDLAPDESVLNVGKLFKNSKELSQQALSTLVNVRIPGN